MNILYLFIVHRNETNVSQCGYQLWNGALLLCDYLLTNQSRFLNKTILELGAGIGLCSLIASRCALKVICTGKFKILP
jgi:predicted nicotinamide N-methyase